MCKVQVRLNPVWSSDVRYLSSRRDRAILLLSIATQLFLGVLFGHYYDMRIFMATGYLVGSGQNPYVAQDLTAVLHNSAFQGMTSIGYPPPWPLVLGFLYRIVYAIVPNLLVYNLAIKIPVIAANVGLAYFVFMLLNNLGVDASKSRKAWVFLLLNPFLLFFASAWGQFDSIVLYRKPHPDIQVLDYGAPQFRIIDRRQRLGYLYSEGLEVG